MSSEHFVVMVRGGRIKVRDLTTTNATTVDGVEIWGDSADATHGTKIKAGDTEFVLVLIP
jgi:pSer/pThr/pTyr-binding forkhead associated (FHA) protein